MKKVVIFAILLALAAALGCKKERWLRVYNAGEFEDSINVTGWEVNEDVVWLDEFYYPWQGEDSIDYSGGYYFYKGRKLLDEDPGPLLTVNGKTVGITIDYPLEVFAIYEAFDSSKIITIDYSDPWLDEQNYNLATLERFPNLVGVQIGLDSRTDLEKLDSIPSSLRLYVSCGYATDEALEFISRYPNIRTLGVGERWVKVSPDGVKHIWKLKELRSLATPHDYLFRGWNSRHLPKLRELYSPGIILY